MAFLGMRGSGDFVTNEMPENWREMILYLFPNGEAPLTAVLSKLQNESTDAPIFHWWEEVLPIQAGPVTAGEIFSEITLTTAIAANGTVAGTTVYVQVTAALASEFRGGHTVLLRDTSNPDVDVQGIVTDRTINGASSYVSVRITEADDNATNTDGLQTVDRLLIIGTAHAEGEERPDSIQYDPTERNNVTQIFRTSVDITGTAKQTHLRTGSDKLSQQKERALRLHSIQIENAFIWGGFNSTALGANGKPRRLMRGAVEFIKDQGTDQYEHYPTASAYNGRTWLQSGEDWLDDKMEILFKFGSTEKVALCGTAVLKAIARLVKNTGTFNFTADTRSYGIKTVEWTTPYGVLHLLRHPLFAQEVTNNKSMLILDPEGLKYRFLRNRDTQFREMDNESGVDGDRMEWLTECSLELHHPQKHMYLTGIGDNNS